MTLKKKKELERGEKLNFSCIFFWVDGTLVQEGKLDYTMNNFHSSFPRLKYGKMKIKMQLETVVRHKNTQKRM